MITEKSSQSKNNIFTTPPPSKKFVSPKSISRKPNFVSFTKKKPTEIAQIRSSDRIRFISPTKANLFIAEDMSNVQNSIDFNYTQYSSNEQINYPFIKRCASPKHFDHVSISRKSSFSNNLSSKQDNSFFENFLEPSIQDFSNCQLGSSNINSSELLQQQISDLKKRNFELNLLVDEKNDFIEKQKIEYDSRLAQLTNELIEIKDGVQSSEKKIESTEQKISSYQNKTKQLEAKLAETTDKLQKAERQIKMYKAKYRINFNNPKDKQDLKSKKYHSNCCKGNQNHVKGVKNHDSNCSKPNTLKQSRKINMIEGATLKKIKSESILPAFNMMSLDVSPQASRLMKIHANEEQFNEYISLKVQIQNLAKQIRYKDIEILTLKKTKSEFERQKQNFQKVKKFNKKLLYRVQFLTKQYDGLQNKKRLSLPVDITPKKKFKVQYEDFNEQQQDDDISQLVQFELSPQKHMSQIQTFKTDIIFEGSQFE